MIYNGHDNHLDDTAMYVRQAAVELRPHRREFKFLVATGMSGVIVGSPLALRVNRPLVVIRKPTDDSHQHSPVVNRNDAEGPYVIIDDFISSGATLRRIHTVMEEECWFARYAGTYLYSDDLLSWKDDGKIAYHPRGSGYDPHGTKANDFLDIVSVSGCDRALNPEPYAAMFLS